MASVIPYFYCLYFAALLVHRERRDDQACRSKYGRYAGPGVEQDPDQRHVSRSLSLGAVFHNAATQRLTAV